MFLKYLRISFLIFSFALLASPIQAQQKVPKEKASKEKASKATVASAEDSAALHDPARWKKLQEREKANFIRDLIEALKKEEIILKKDPSFYAEQIDLNETQDPALFAKPIGIQLSALAILYGDYNNGENPFDLIRATFGESFYMNYIHANTMRTLSQKYDDWKRYNDLKIKAAKK